MGYQRCQAGKVPRISAGGALTRADVWETAREDRSAGTKAHSRDRVCSVADWAWDAEWKDARRVFPGARLWPEWTAARSPTGSEKPSSGMRRIEAAYSRPSAIRVTGRVTTG